MHLKFHLKEHLKLHKNVKKRMHLWCSCASKDALGKLRKDVQKGACEVASKVVLELHMWLHLWMQSLMCKCVQNNGVHIMVQMRKYVNLCI